MFPKRIKSLAFLTLKMSSNCGKTISKEKQDQIKRFFATTKTNISVSSNFIDIFLKTNHMVEKKTNLHNFSIEIQDYLFNPRKLSIEPDQEFAKILEEAKIKKLKTKLARKSVGHDKNKCELMEESGINCFNTNVTGCTNEESLKTDLLSIRENDSGNETYLSSMVSLTTDGSFGRLSLTPNRLNNTKM